MREINITSLINKHEAQSIKTNNSTLIELKLNNSHSVIIPKPNKYNNNLRTTKKY